MGCFCLLASENNAATRTLLLILFCVFLEVGFLDHNSKFNFLRSHQSVVPKDFAQPSNSNHAVSKEIIVFLILTNAGKEWFESFVKAYYIALK